MIKSPKKLIEVALPLKAINAAAAREKSIRHGHPSTLHLWWARRPLAAARAVLFAQLVNDPGGQRGWDSRKGITKEKAQQERKRLFKIIEDLVKWENANSGEILAAARREINRSWRETCEMNKGEPGFDPDRLPAFHDPFAGGGAIPLEAQRLGLEAHASDLNPVAVVINKAMIEIPPRFANRAPIGPLLLEETPMLQNSSLAQRAWPDASGLAEDVRRYGAWIREEAKKRIGHLYPTVRVTKEMAAMRPDLANYVGRDLPVIAWLWARTVKSPHPAYADCDVPLISSFVLSSKESKEAWVEPIVDGRNWHFEIRVGKPPKDAGNGTSLGKRKAFKCLISGTPIGYDYIRDFGKSEGLGQRLFAVVLDGPDGRTFIEPTPEMEAVAKSEKPKWKPNMSLPNNTRDFKTPNYGLTTYGDLFTDRQLVALNTFLDLVQEARAKVLVDTKTAFWADDGIRLADGGIGPTAYADAVAMYLAIGVSRLSEQFNSGCRWKESKTQVVGLFGRQAIPMVWDFAENNVFNNAAGDFGTTISSLTEAIQSVPCGLSGIASQADAQLQTISQDKIVSTDPPYYDNIAYADLSDFFYVWLRRGIRNIFPALFATIETPKEEELVASPYRHGGAEKAEAFFMDGMMVTMRNLAAQAHLAFPVTIYYAYKQSETNDVGTSNAGWETFLEAVIRAGFQIVRTWPMRTEMENRQIASGKNALASSIVLVCRKRPADASSCERRDFLRELREQMPTAIDDLVGADENTSPVSPVDMPQAIIGPGMEIFSKYAEVLNADGSRMSVHDAIREINNFIVSNDFDLETQFCLDWFKVAGWGEHPSGDAINMAQAKGLSVGAVVDSGVLASRGGKTKLIHWRDYPEDYDPANDRHRPAWEVCHHLVRIHQKRGSTAAGSFLALVQEQGESARQLAYQLYTLCERKGLAEDARPYNELVTAWDDILAAAGRALATDRKQQLELF